MCSTNLTDVNLTSCLVVTDNFTLSISSSDNLTDLKESRTLLVVEGDLSSNKIFATRECTSDVTIINLIVTNILSSSESSYSIVIGNDVVANKFVSRELRIKITRIICKVYNIDLRLRNIIKNNIRICLRGQSVEEQTEERRTIRNIDLFNKFIGNSILICRSCSNSCNNTRRSTNNNVIELNVIQTRFGLICTNCLAQCQVISNLDVRAVHGSILLVSNRCSLKNTSSNTKSCRFSTNSDSIDCEDLRT